MPDTPHNSVSPRVCPHGKATLSDYHGCVDCLLHELDELRRVAVVLHDEAVTYLGRFVEAEAERDALHRQLEAVDLIAAERLAERDALREALHHCYGYVHYLKTSGGRGNQTTAEWMTRIPELARYDHDA